MDGASVKSREGLLKEFVDWCAAHITGDEKGQAQVFVDRLLKAFGQKGAHEAGGTFEERIKRLFDEGKRTSFADYVWKPVVLIEMKTRGADLARHRQQAFDYWTHIAPGRPRYVILCNFDELWVYDFNNQIYSPKDKVALTDLPRRWGPLAFLFPTNEQPVFGNDTEKVTREAADKLAECFKIMVNRGVQRELAQRFVLQSMVAMFAEDIGLLPRYLFTNLVKACDKPSDSYDLLGGLFEAMNSREGTTGGRYKGVRYFNGGLFAVPARVELATSELETLRGTEAKPDDGAVHSDWSKVSPEIFGAIFQESMEKEQRHAFGAHFTSAADIMKIVKPTISDPWKEAIESAKSPKRLSELLDRLSSLRVLDPACGSGNFLYLAYREMKRLETRIRERFAAEFPGAQPSLLHVSARQFYGIDINPFAVELAKVTLMLARKLAIEELHIHDEAELPLDNLDANFLAADALLSQREMMGEINYFQTPWAPADVIIGNPPFLDARKMTMEHGRKYVKLIEKLYPEISRRADYCTYWLRRAHDHLPACVDPFGGRAGLVGTQNIRNNEAREAGLDHIVKTGTVVEAVDNQPWSGEANVHVSIVNWMKTQDEKLVPDEKRLWTRATLPPGARRRAKGRRADKTYELTLQMVDAINSALSAGTDVSTARVLAANRSPKRCFEGQQPGARGFRLTAGEFEQLRQQEDVSPIVFPYLNGTDLLAGRYAAKPEYIIDFGTRDMIEAQRFPRTLQVLTEHVLPEWQANAAAEKERSGKTTGEHQRRLETWWKLKRRRGDLIQAVGALPRYVVCSRVTKRPVFVFVDSGVRPDSSLTCFALSDDYSFGILQSHAHWLWFITKCSKLTERFRYTPESVFDTFPWPQSPTDAQVDAVALAGREVRRVREEALRSTRGGLRAVYRTLELPGRHPLKDAHVALDAAVLRAYEFDPQGDLLAQLLGLNQTVAMRERERDGAAEGDGEGGGGGGGGGAGGGDGGGDGAGGGVTAPGIPASYHGDRAALVTADCIRP